MKDRNRRRPMRFAATLLAALSLLGSSAPRPAKALFLDESNSLEVIAKVQTRASVRTEDSSGFTAPRIGAGSLVQQRNLAVLEINHDLEAWAAEPPALAHVLQSLGLRVKVHLVGRFLYEGVYDYGDKAFREAKDLDPENIRSFQQSHELWECYADLYKGPLSLRLGRQNLSWGETDVFRLLDAINPLDNTFGGPFEDLDDRRIPLWMVRASLNLGRIGPASSVTLESFWVPGPWDARVSPVAPAGSPYAPPMPEDLVRFVRYVYPDRTMANCRWGFRILGLPGPNWSVAVGHYQSFPDIPALRAVVDPKRLSPPVARGHRLLTDVEALRMEASWPTVRITGASSSYWQPHIDAVLRCEIAWFHDEPVFIPRKNLNVLYGPVLPLPPEILDLASELYGIDIRSLGLAGIPVDPVSGTIPKRDVLRFMAGFDKQLWIRPLNPSGTFFLTLQYFGQWIPHHDAEMRQALSLYPLPTDFTVQRAAEHTVTGAMQSTWWHGRVTPQMAFAWDPRGAWLVQPSVTLARDPFRLGLQYSSILGAFTSFGAFRDRDQVTVSLTWLLQ